MQYEHFYLIATNEIDDGKCVTKTSAEAFTLAEGDETKGKCQYCSPSNDARHL